VVFSPLLVFQDLRRYLKIRQFLEKFTVWAINLLPTITPTGTVNGVYRHIPVVRPFHFLLI
jgi:hypothetical protein